jgi:hypothetical protein
MNFFNQPVKVAGVGEIPVMQKHFYAGFMPVFVEVIDTIRIEGAGPADNAVNLVAFIEQQLGQIRSVLSGDPGD